MFPSLTKNQKKWLAAGVISLLSLAAMTLLVFWNPLEKVQLNLSNYLYYERDSSYPIVIVAIDNKSIDENQGLGRFALWTRKNYAQALNNLQKYQPAVIGLDIFFKDPSQGISGSDLEKLSKQNISNKDLVPYFSSTIHPYDQALLQAISIFKKVVLINSGIALDEKFQKLDLAVLNLKFSPVDPYSKFIEQQGVQVAHNAVWKDPNGLIRSMIPFFQFKDHTYLSFALAIAAEYKNLGTLKNQSVSDNQFLAQFENGQLNIPLDNYQYLLNFTQKTRISDQNLNSKNILVVPFVEVYNDNYTTLDPSIFKDKIVLIGAWARSLNDNQSTPISPTDPMPGVMIHAEAVQTILDQAWLRNMSPAEQILLLALLISLSSLAIFQLRLRWALPLLLTLALSYLLLWAPLAFRHLGLISNLVYPVIAIVLTALCGYSYRYLTEFKQKNIVANVLGHYVNREVQNTALENGDQAAEIGGTKRDITVIFTDIKGFTSISESLSPQSLVTLLNEYFEVMAAIIEKNGGVIDKFEGDAIMALFGATTPRPDHARSACQAALEMRAALPGLVEKWHHDPPLPGGEPKPEIDFRVGVSSGPAIVGNIGTSQKIEFTAIGDIVNLGSRLESANKKYQTRIMISEATFEQIQNFYECRFLDLVRVKGKQQPVKTYQLLCPKGQLDNDQHDLILEYNHGLQLYFESRFAEADQVFQEIIFHWPDDYLSKIYAGRCELLKRFPPTADWDFVYNLESK